MKIQTENIKMKWTLTVLWLIMVLLFLAIQATHAQEVLVPKVQGDLSLKAEHPALVGDTTYLDVNGKAYPLLGRIPIELRTAEQNVYLKKLYRVLIKYYEVENNHQVFKLDEPGFLKMGLSKYDYQLVLRGLEENNKFFDANGTKDVDRLIREFKVETEAWLNKEDETIKK